MNRQVELNEILGEVSQALAAAVRFSIGDFEMSGVEAAFEAQLPKEPVEDDQTRLRKRVARLLNDDCADERFERRRARGRAQFMQEPVVREEEKLGVQPILDFGEFAEAFIDSQGRDRQLALDEALSRLVAVLRIDRHSLSMDLMEGMRKFRVGSFAARRNAAKEDMEKFEAFFAEMRTEDGRQRKAAGFGRAHSAGVAPYGFTIEELRELVSEAVLADLGWLNQREDRERDAEDGLAGDFGM